jgi:hypothetical protein
MLLAEGRCRSAGVPPGHILEGRAPLETDNDLRREHTACVQRIHVLQHRHQRLSFSWRTPTPYLALGHQALPHGGGTR